MKRLTAALLALPIQAAAQPAFGGGGAGGLQPRTVLNNIGNFIISDVGIGLCFLALLLAILGALYSSAFGGQGGGRSFGMTCMWIVGFFCVGAIMAVLTGGANFGGASGIF